MGAEEFCDRAMLGSIPLPPFLCQNFCLTGSVRLRSVAASQLVFSLFHLVDQTNLDTLFQKSQHRNSVNPFMSLPTFQSASPYKDDVLALPVTDLDAASKWYCKHFGMVEVERSESPHPAVILERDGVRIRFAINGGDPAQEGAAIRVTNIDGMKAQLKTNGIEVANTRVDERDGEKFNVFFVVAPDGLCYYFNEPIA